VTPPKRDLPEESRRVLLRTSADVLEHAAKQAGALAEEWPEFGAEVRRFCSFVDRVTAKAREHGHRPRPRNRRAS
jgi:hypothetical protein